MTDQALSDINPLDPNILACPHAFNQRLREEAPVYLCPRQACILFLIIQPLSKSPKTRSFSPTNFQ